MNGNSGQKFTAFKFFSFSEGIFFYVYNLFTATYGGLKSNFQKIFLTGWLSHWPRKGQKAPFGPKH
jgi:hypothetical protein